MLQNCTLNSNISRSVGGGGICTASFYGAEATVRLQTCILSGNMAAAGGGIYSVNNSGVGTVTMENCTVSGNSASDGERHIAWVLC